MLTNMKLVAPLLLILVCSAPGNSMSKQEDLPKDEFARRRAIFLEELRELNACAVFHTAPMYPRNNDVEHPFRQDSDFYYLTGWPHRDALLMLTPQEDTEKGSEVTLFVAPRNLKMEVWTGPKKGVDEALTIPGVDQAYDYDILYDHLAKMISGYDRLVISYGANPEFKRELDMHLEKSWTRPSITQEASALLKSHRLIKSDYEIEALEKAITITHQSFQDLLPLVPSMSYEYEAQAMIEYGFAKRGAERLGFPSIVGAGQNATYLHYEDNRGVLNKGELLLLDIGAEWEYYSADISRTIPISGRFSPEQRAIYELVLAAQLAAIDKVEPGTSWRKPHDTAIQVITEGLVELELLEGKIDTLIQTKAYRKFFMHGTSHWLGLDVHDAGGWLAENGKPHILKAGMVLTVEPGIYIKESEDVDPKWWNIGIRLEDDVLVTPKGHKVLSQNIPKTIDEIEGLMQP